MEQDIHKNSKNNKENSCVLDLDLLSHGSPSLGVDSSFHVQTNVSVRRE
jgi:hypothetical protein